MRLIALFILLIPMYGLLAQENKIEKFLNQNGPFSESDTIIVKELNKEAYHTYDIDLEKTRLLALKAFQISKEINYQKGISESCRIIGIYHHKKANYDTAMYYYQKANQIAEEHNLKREVASSLNNIALLLYFKGNYPLALEKYFRCIEIREELGDTLKLATPINNIALIYSQQNKHDKALEYFFRSLQIEKVIGDSSRLGLNYMNIATQFAAMDSIQLAIEYFNQSEQICIANKNELTLSYVYSRLADIYDRAGDYERANSYHLQGLEIAYKLDAKYEIANALSGIANHYFLQGKLPGAIKYADSAKNMARELEIPAVTEVATKVLYESNLRLKNYKKAFDDLLLNRQINDSLRNEKNLQLMYEFEYEKKLKDSEIEKARREALLVQHRFIISLLIITLLIGLAFILLLLYRNKEKKKNNLILIAQKEELNSYKNHLEEKVKERTDDLRTALVKAKESNLLKTQFLNNISHEIRTPMNGIVGFSDMLDDENMSIEERRSCVKIIKSSSDQLLKIIDDIVEMSVFETKSVQTEMKRFNLNEMMNSIYSIFKLKSKERGIPLTLKMGLANSQSNIVSDQMLLTKILNNLVENALKFTPEGRIEMGYFVQDQTLVFYVNDTGVGISKENLKSIFDRFSQEERALSRRYGGLGLGLSISKENAHLLGGDIKVESEKGKGSTFYVTIPYVKE